MSTVVAPPPPRLRSLDAYRGFIMLAMASGGASALSGITDPDGSAWNDLLSVLRHQTDHALWRGCVFWDLIMPAFILMVGVAMPFSYAARVAQGENWSRMFAHALKRSVVLIAIAVFLHSNGQKQTNFLFINTLAQIGLAYPFAFLLLGCRPRIQLVVALAILIADWLLFAIYPLPSPGFNYADVGATHPEAVLTGFLGHWSMNTNVAAAFDRWFLNLFPRPAGQPFLFQKEGYPTINFIPSISTMIFGMLAGQLVRSDKSAPSKLRILFVSGAICLLSAVAMDLNICPIVKKIWTPSFTLLSAGWTLWMLAAFYAVIDVAGFRRWSFALAVVGMNSIAMYLMAQLLKPFVTSTLRTHLGQEVFTGPYGALIRSSSILLVFWLICFWMYRQKIFIRI